MLGVVAHAYCVPVGKPVLLMLVPASGVSP